jgi:DnaK suppressor protein
MASPKKIPSKKAASSQVAGAKEKAKSGKTSAKAKASAKPKAEVKTKAAATGLAARRAEVPAYLRTIPPRPRAEAVDEPPHAGEVAGKPQKPQVDEEWQKNMREALAAQRQRMLAVVQSTQAQMAEKAGDLADISDRASEGFEDELAVGLMAIEAAQLEDINDAIERIDNGNYGLCVTCKRAIPRKRLEVLPFARRCLACEGEAERHQRMVASQSDDEEIE